MIRLTIYGEPASKANSRQLVTIKGRPAFIKSAKARSYAATAAKQIPHAARVGLEGPVAVEMVIYYRTHRPDLDESVILDALQSQGGMVGVYRNDRQVREKHIFHRIDRDNPRAEITVRPIE